MRKPVEKVAILPLLVLALAALAGCVDEKIVYVDRELFEEPLAAAGSFLGYSNQETKLTVCGNCHIEKQGGWAETGHADAWDVLQESGGAQAFCEGCHTVGANGNAVTGDVGYAATGDERYEDVQCENCHGPGLAHVSNPTGLNVPLAALNVTSNELSGCAQCHSDTHHPFVEEWAASRHGEATTNESYRVREGCSYCHGGEAALEAWGVNTEFIEKGQGEEIGVTCAVCHDPHAEDNEHQLRFPIDVLDVEENLCMKCHHKRAIPDEGSSRGPHSPQGPLLIGELGQVGWIPPNFAYDTDRIAGTHGSEANERTCAGCHVNAFTVTDASTGDFLLNATGHLFKAIPCLDAQGIPTGDDSCAMTTEARTFGSCTTSGCHGSATAALSAMTIAQARMEDLVTELNALLALVPADQFSSSDGVYTVAEGSKFNSGLGAIESSAVHNPFLTEALLTASIAIMKTEYGLAAQTGVDLDDIMWNLSGTQR
jgi:predicted CXXCH cytochrome family protein